MFSRYHNYRAMLQLTLAGWLIATFAGCSVPVTNPETADNVSDQTQQSGSEAAGDGGAESSAPPSGSTDAMLDVFFVPGSMPDDCCVIANPGDIEPVGCGDRAVEDCVCEIQPSCCAVLWGPECVAEAATVCGGV